MILREALAAGIVRLREAGIDNPTRDARALIAKATGLHVSRVALEPDFALTDDMRQGFDAMLARRAAREPVSKILGKREFWGREFHLTKDTLDPRPETESLIAAALEGAPAARFADLGTGTGIIAITLLLEWPDAVVFATDISGSALKIAEANAETHGVTERMQLLQISQEGDWYGALPGDLDLIVSNPPYISDEEMQMLSPEVRDHDPHLALTPGGDGLQPYRAIADGALRHLVPGGQLLVEIGWKQGAAVADIFRAAGLKGIAVLPDLDGRDRVVSATAPL